MVDSSDFVVHTLSSFMETVEVDAAELGQLPARVSEQFYLVFYQGKFMRAFPSKQDAERFIASLVEELNALEFLSKDLVERTFHELFNREKQKWDENTKKSLLEAQKAILKILEIEMTFELALSGDVEELGRSDIPGP